MVMFSYVSLKFIPKKNFMKNVIWKFFGKSNICEVHAGSETCTRK